jgi:tetratricopeptide (TPR) repeat protein
MIVRDEEGMLPAALASAGGVDEIVVVDTGSRDGTREVAMAAGAHVVEFPWCDDFAAARNAALDAARADWVLSLDADERLGPGAVSAVRSAVGRGGFELGMLRLHNATRVDAPLDHVLRGVARTGPPLWVPRLARRRPDLRWQGVIHEGWGEWARRTGARAVPIDADIIHLGSVAELRASRGKAERNLRLLRRRRHEEPDNPLVRQWLARELIVSGAVGEAAAEAADGWERFLASLDHRSPEQLRSVEGLGAILAEIRLRGGDLPGCESVLTQLRTWGLQHPDQDHIEGLLGLERGRRRGSAETRRQALEVGLAAFQRAIDTPGMAHWTEVSPGVCTWRSWEGRAVALLMLGRPLEAAASWEVAELDAPDGAIQRVGRGEGLLAAGRLAEALRLLEPELTGAADAAVVTALALEATGRYQDARTLLRLTTGRARNPGLRPHRRAVLWGLEARLGLAATLGARGITLPAELATPGPPGVCEPHLQAAEEWLAAGRGEEAIVLLALASRYDPWDPRPWEALARLFLGRGEAAEAETARRVAELVDGA